MEIMDKELTVPKMGADSFAEDTPKFIQSICSIDPKVWDIVENRLHWASVVWAFDILPLHDTDTPPRTSRISGLKYQVLKPTFLD